MNRTTEIGNRSFDYPLRVRSLILRLSLYLKLQLQRTGSRNRCPSSRMSPIEDLLGAQVLDRKKQPIHVASFSGKGKVIGLYFSAHWCPPCRGFTPVLAEFYLKQKAARPDGFEVVFVSSDRDESQWSTYFDEMPWLALPFNDRARKEAIASKYGITGIPTLVLLDAETGETINANARNDVVQNPDGKGFPWRK